MSKNVAVFVDVANIFYAAKAAGVDIDYVTLLKSAVAGRDFVRAYAYTGLDPDNENQRQFHSFLARNGYKVVSKDIRKYGDGKIKANLDIELVVDLMRMSQNLDIAVVVSGDGDFAPAIRAVQQMGVRVEVVSFRGNTSSDLIEVADVFTDIGQIARVEKGSSRSGRRVAAEGDLSMTEVPDKETEGASRRRRTGRGRGEREERLGRPAVGAVDMGRTETAGMPGNLIVLPGEKLSRVVAAGPGGPVDDESEESLADEAVGPTLAALPDSPVVPDGDRLPDAVAVDEEGPRRRRRRGGRGRGRGRGGERDAVPVLSGTEEDEPLDEYETPRLPQHSTFGSVWDSQLGVASPPPVSAGSDGDVEPEDEDEPEIPEYLLAERRQRGRMARPTGRPGAGGRGRGGRSAAYQSAIDRERFGRPSTFGGQGFSPRRDDRPREERPPRDNRGQGARRGPERVREQAASAPRASNGDPWSEVPPEVEELLKAELSRRGRPERPAETGTRPVGDNGIGELEPDEVKGAAAYASPSDASATVAVGQGAVSEPAPARRRRAPVRRTTPTADRSPSAEQPSADDVTAVVADEPEAPRTPRRRSTRRPARGGGEVPAASDAPEADAMRGQADAAGDQPAAVSADVTPRTRRSPRRTAASQAPPADEAQSADAGTTPIGNETAEAPPKRRTTRRRASPETSPEPST